MDIFTILLCLVLTIPHAFYAFIWIYPNKWMSISKKYYKYGDSIDLMAYCVFIIKGIQFIGLFLWTFIIDSSNFEFKNMSIFQFIIAIPMIIFGQSLNIGIHKAIGKNGVYYGCRLGKTIPWVNGFPFTIVRHPQYVGVVLCIWAAIILVYTDTLMERGLINVGIYWTLCYIVTALTEDYL